MYLLRYTFQLSHNVFYITKSRTDDINFVTTTPELQARYIPAQCINIRLFVRACEEKNEQQRQ